MHLPPAVTGSAIVAAGLALLALIIRMVGPWRKQIDDLEERMREELRAERKRAEAERDQCEAKLVVVKHRERRNRQLIYSLLRLFDVPAARRKEMLANIREELAAIEQAEATEAAIVATAGIRESEE